MLLISMSIHLRNMPSINTDSVSLNCFWHTNTNRGVKITESEGKRQKRGRKGRRKREKLKA